MVRCRAYDPRVVGSKPALATFEENILGQGVNTNCASLSPPWNINGYLIRSYERCVWLHPAICC